MVKITRKNFGRASTEIDVASAVQHVVDKAGADHDDPARALECQVNELAGMLGRLIAEALPRLRAEQLDRILCRYDLKCED